jgi:hypothetical protein
MMTTELDFHCRSEPLCSSQLLSSVALSDIQIQSCVAHEDSASLRDLISLLN